MKNFKLPEDLKYNRGLIEDPASYIQNAHCESWLFLVGTEFASMPGGISYDQVQEATPESINVISDPPRVLDLDLARQQVAALDFLPRPTLISCRTGPRASAVAYMYSGLKLGADPEEVIAAAVEEQAPFTTSEEYKQWVRDSIELLRAEADEDMWQD